MELEILDVEEGSQLTNGIIKDEDNEEEGHSHGETSKRWNHLVHCAVSLSTVVDGFAWVEGTYANKSSEQSEDDENDSEEVKDLNVSCLIGDSD
ncbi:hypothetical protein BDR07DRAFT_1493899 [Suillus spraguei]|nr:hypothetical protein BDR07DRAFT_1493899 [Suillus spraguei]